MHVLPARVLGTFSLNNSSLILLFCLIFCLSPGLKLQAQQLEKVGGPAYVMSEAQVPGELKELVASFFSEMGAKRPVAAFDKLLAGSRILNDSSNVAKLVQQAQRALDFYGPQSGVEFISAEAVTNSFVRLRYLALHREYPIKWVMTFYRAPDKGWIVALLRLDDKVESSFTDGW